MRDAEEIDDLSDGGRRRVGAVDRASQVLDCLAVQGRPMTAYDVARRIGAPLSSVYGVVDALVRNELLVRDGEGPLRLGPRLYRWGLAYGRDLSLLAVCEAEMAGLGALIGETVQVCGRDGGDMVVLAMSEPQRPFRVASRVGTRSPLNWTASGRLLVGHLPDPERRRLFAEGARASPTGRAETDPDRLAAAAAAALARRLAVQISEADETVACIAAPVLDADGACVATISIVLPAQKARERQRTYAASVQEAASRVEDRMGWTAAVNPAALER